ncbi:hypothetical protein K505DRAFT_270528 [Melanomma pulvis-pyrius CBS 109.77]|uniref:Saccharopine dehydrogenase NADP binding domain-containing protein n=1 Tax=Melanomma pulvis-pyrius CBS 109.77 TaxID=1314802 RepID=A0A6A6XKG6_9PLEO|nr:hypothetical protein K505DRAFT_270528 [Melanomma pulvis-pyrius CBS 109.77]
MSNPEFDIILLGATGYTGTITAEHITSNFPTTLKWAIAGRSLTGLETLEAQLKTLNPDRNPPVTILAHLEKDELHILVRRTSVMINSIGPYHRYSEPIVKACADEGVHYVDFSTETPWIAEMVARYHDTARSNNAIMIHAASNSSAPPDLLAWLIASKIRKKSRKATKQIIARGKLTMVGMGGGSANTVLSSVQRYGVGWLLNPDPLSLVPQGNQHGKGSKSWTWGFRKHPELGTLTPSLTGVSNTAVVQRSAYLQPSLYTKDFTYTEYNPAPHPFGAIVITLLTKFMVLFLALPPIRKLLSKLIYKPGHGPDWRENAKSESVVIDAVGEGVDGMRVKGKFVWTGAVVHVSAVLVAEAAAVLVEMGKRQECEGMGGMQTPSFLGNELVERLRILGCLFEIEK